MKMQGEKCELRVLDPNDDYQVGRYTESVNAGWTTEYLFTGSIPMRPVDVQVAWQKEREAGSVEWGIWVKHPQGDNRPAFARPVNFIGTVGLYSYKPIYRSWELRIIIFEPDAIGKGIGPEATRMVLDWAFDRLNAHRVWLGVNAMNERAIKCYEKVGFKREGLLRHDIFTMGRYCDAIRMSVLEHEWRAMHNANTTA